MNTSHRAHAIAHGVEGASYCARCQPESVRVNDVQAMRARSSKGLPRVMPSRDRHARAEVCMAWLLLDGCWGHITMALHHKLAHVLGGKLRARHMRNPCNPCCPYGQGFNATRRR